MTRENTFIPGQQNHQGNCAVKPCYANGSGCDFSAPFCRLDGFNWCHLLHTAGLYSTCAVSYGHFQEGPHQVTICHRYFASNSRNFGGYSGNPRCCEKSTETLGKTFKLHRFEQNICCFKQFEIVLNMDFLIRATHFTGEPSILLQRNTLN